MRRVALAIMVWLAAIALSALLDRPVAVWIRDSGIAAYMRVHDEVAGPLRVAGVYYFTLGVAIAVTIVHRLRWRAGAFVLLATLVSSLNGLTKWIVGRTRPFKLDPLNEAQPFVLSPFRGGIAGMTQSKNLCFPSGHAALAFATAAAVAMLWPRSPWRWGAYAVAVIVACERVSENAHWVSDTVAAAALGVGGVYLIRWLLIKLLGERLAKWPEPRDRRGFEVVTERPA